MIFHLLLVLLESARTRIMIASSIGIVRQSPIDSRTFRETPEVRDTHTRGCGTLRCAALRENYDARSVARRSINI